MSKSTNWVVRCHQSAVAKSLDQIVGAITVCNIVAVRPRLRPDSFLLLRPTKVQDVLQNVGQQIERQFRFRLLLPDAEFLFALFIRHSSYVVNGVANLMTRTNQPVNLPRSAGT